MSDLLRESVENTRFMRERKQSQVNEGEYKNLKRPFPPEVETFMDAFYSDSSWGSDNDWGEEEDLKFINGEESPFAEAGLEIKSWEKIFSKRFSVSDEYDDELSTSGVLLEVEGDGKTFSIAIVYVMQEGDERIDGEWLPYEVTSSVQSAKADLQKMGNAKTEEAYWDAWSKFVDKNTNSKTLGI